jgi:hypothetical protein
LLTAIVNHNRNANAIALRQGFAPLSPVVLIDSGSAIAEEERAWFDECLPNVYYSGLLNRTCAFANALPDDDALLLICSDVEIDQPETLVARLTEAFRDPSVMVWGPTSLGSPHPQMWPRTTGQIRQVSFVEGFCFAARKSLLARVCPVDLAVNRYGWGIDVLLGYLAASLGGRSLVDDGIEVRHPITTGYAIPEARAQRDAWFARLSPRARRFRQLATLPGVREGLGCRLLCRWAAGARP